MRGSVVDAPDSQARGVAVEALFAQARRRRKRRRLLLVVVSLGLAGAVAAGVIVGGGHGGAVRSRASRPPAGLAKSGPARLGLPAVQLAWVADDGSLTVGDPATGTRLEGPTVDASTSGPLVSVAGQLYWADANRDGAPIRDYSLVTGKVRYLQRGEAVFTSADRRLLYIAPDNRTVLQLAADGSGRAVALKTPVGWYMSGFQAGWIPMVAAGGIIVATSDNPDYVPGSAREGLWNPATGHVRVLGAGMGIFGVYTPPGQRYSLIAWVSASRGTTQDNVLRITKTSADASVVVRSPLHFGFVASGAPAFSSDGTQLAVFVRTAALGSSEGSSRLAFVSTATGAVRLVPGTALDTTEDAFWAMWLPGTQQILAGAVGSAYAVDAQTLAVRRFVFFPGTAGFSAVVLPAPR